MTLDLPKPIAAYFTADKATARPFLECFTEDAVVKDEGHTYRGRAAIKQWKDGCLGQVPVHERAARVRAEGRQSSSSPAGSPATFPAAPSILRFFFGLEGDKIASLEIIP